MKVKTFMKTLLTVLITIASLIVLILLYMISGIFNPSSTTPHGHLTLWAINMTSEFSIEKRAQKVLIPDISDSTLIEEGFMHYNEMCVMCHSAPGIDESEINKGLYPKAPLFYKFASKMNPRETFWIIKNGIKMSGMPAFSPTHDDQKIWAITAFITKELGKMKPEDYKAWQKNYKGEEE